MNLYQRIMGAPWVYDTLRTFALGGFDFQEAYDWLELTPSDVVVDVGCGTGAAFNFIPPATSYHGFDTDARALKTFRQKHPQDNIHLYPTLLTPAHVHAIKPTKALLFGLLHHLSDDEIRSLLQTLARCPSLERIVSQDVIYLPRKPVNNFLASLDRGRFVRTESRYRELIAGSHFAVEGAKFLHSGNKAATYFIMRMQPVVAVDSTAAA